MVCKNLELISECFENKLDEKTKDQLEKHINSCQECSNLLKFLKAVKPLPKLSPSKDFTSNILNKLGKQSLIQNIYCKFNSIFEYLLDHMKISVLTLVLLVGAIAFNIIQKDNLVKVSFTVPMGDAQSVSLVGDFNNWDPKQGKLHKKDNFWTGTFHITPGRYQYMLIINGNQWMPDPKAKEYVNDGYGGKNSLLDTTRL